VNNINLAQTRREANAADPRYGRAQGAKWKSRPGLASRARWHAKQARRETATVADFSAALRESSLPIQPEKAKPISPRAHGARISPASRDTGAGLRRVSDKMLSAWRGETVTLPTE
jgi:hypothetical protein